MVKANRKVARLAIAPLSKPAAGLVQVWNFAPQLVIVRAVPTPIRTVAGVKASSTIRTGAGAAGQPAAGVGVGEPATVPDGAGVRAAVVVRTAEGVGEVATPGALALGRTAAALGARGAAVRVGAAVGLAGGNEDPVGPADPAGMVAGRVAVGSGDVGRMAMGVTDPSGPDRDAAGVVAAPPQPLSSRAQPATTAPRMRTPPR